MLDINMQADHLEAPFAVWGTMARKSRLTGIITFTWKITALKTCEEPLDVANSACASIVELLISAFTMICQRLWQSGRCTENAGLRVVSVGWEHNIL
jgi:hypothetical protein